MTVHRVNKNDTGVFTCVVNNGIGRVATANVTLIVETKPVVEPSQVSAKGRQMMLEMWQDEADR